MNGINCFSWNTKSGATTDDNDDIVDWQVWQTIARVRVCEIETEREKERSRMCEKVVEAIVI